MLTLVFFVIGILAQQTFADSPERIVGGTTAALGEFPWQISLQQYGQHICGGSIIGITKILTAAHCVKDICSPSSCKVVTGTIRTNAGQSHTVKSIRIHPRYIGTQADAWSYDVAVITLNQPIQYNQYQSPISLASSLPVPGTRCTLSGWGKTSTHGWLSTNLLKMEQTVVSPPQCKSTYRDMKVGDSHLCALNTYGIGSCQGDSGGPLIANGVQIGVTSWSLSCAQGVPDVYASVPHCRDFILSS